VIEAKATSSAQAFMASGISGGAVTLRIYARDIRANIVVFATNFLP
jgi:uncharacterized protein YoaH (UPF0181 family)